MDQPPNLNNLEILKAARRQVFPDRNAAHQAELTTSPKTPPILSDEILAYDVQEIQENLPRKTEEEKNFVEGLLHKLQILAQEEQRIKSEKEQFDKIWAGLEEKRQKLETRLTAINRIKGKLMALNKEVEDVIKVSA